MQYAIHHTAIKAMLAGLDAVELLFNEVQTRDYTHSEKDTIAKVGKQILTLHVKTVLIEAQAIKNDQPVSMGEVYGELGAKGNDGISEAYEALPF